MEETVLTHLFSNVGVPAAICFYTLFSVNKNIEKLIDAINKLSADIGIFDSRLTRLEHASDELKHAVDDLKRRQ